MALRCFCIVIASLCLMGFPQNGRCDEHSQASIKFGAIFSLTGYGSIAGQGQANATRMAVDEINSAGGVNGKHIELILEDNHSLPRDTVTAFSKIIAGGNVSVILGPNWAEWSEVVAPLAQSNKVLMLTPSGWSRTLTKDKSLVFSTLPGHDTIIKPLAKEMAKFADQKIYALVAQNAYYESMLQGVEKYFNEHKLPAMEIMRINPNESDFRTVIAKIRINAKAAVLCLLGESGELFSFYKQAHDAGFKNQVFSANALLYDPVLLQQLEYANNTILFEYTVETNKNWIEQYRSLFKQEPEPNSSMAYDDVYMIKESIENCGEDAEQIARCLSKIDYDGITGRIHFDPQGNINSLTEVSRLIQVQSGKVVPYTPQQ